MPNAKYIVVSPNDESNSRIIIFPSMINHKDMADAMLHKGIRSHNIISAGFVNEALQCYGESFTLRTKSRPIKDTDLLKKMLDINYDDLIYYNEMQKNDILYRL